MREIKFRAWDKNSEKMLKMGMFMKILNYWR